MPNPGSFTGSRGEFLKEQRARYAKAVQDGNINDIVADIQRQYFKRYPITLAHNEEPSQEWLDQVNDDAPDPEIEPPNVSGMSPEDASKALQEHTDLIKKLKDRKDSIRRRLHYMYSKENDPRPSTKSGIATDIVSALTAKIVGVDSKLPRQKTAYNYWGPQHREIVDPVFNKRIEEGNVPTTQHIALRSTIYKELFERLPQDERELWAKAAIREHEKAVREIRKNLEKGASTTPLDRQQVITALPSIIEPIFDLLAEHTGWKFSVIAGGPEPADAGRLNLIMIHSGVIPGTIKADFGRDQHEAFKKLITPSFGSFLKKCYTIDECRARALPEGFDIRSLADIKAEEPLDLYSFDVDKEHVNTSKSHKGKRLFEKEVKSHKSKKMYPLQDNTPSSSEPPLRFGPPIGKPKKLRELPSKDKPKDIFLQGFTQDDLGDLPNQRILTADEASSLYGAVAAALQCYVSTAARTNPPTPAPSRDPLSMPFREADSTSSKPPPRQAAAQDAAASPIVAPKSLPPSPATSRPPSPLRAFERDGSPGTTQSSMQASTVSPVRPDVPPSHPATSPPSRPATPPPSCPATPPPSCPATLPLSRPATPPGPSRPATPPPSHPAILPAYSVVPPATLLLDVAIPPIHHPAASAAPQHPSSSPRAAVHPDTPDDGSAAFPTAPRHRTPSGAVTVPELPEVHEDLTNSRTRSTRVVSGGSEKRKAPVTKIDTPKKKLRTNGNAPFDPAFPLDLPSDCPNWVRNTLNLLTKEDLGPTWRDLVVAWLRFEEKSGFDQEGQRLCAQGRPACIGQWVKRARAAGFQPDLGDVNLYEATFLKWWNRMQPDWRNAGDDAEVGGGRSGDDWSSLEGCYGLNGILSAVAALFFWGSAVGAGGELAVWNLVVADTLYILQQLE